jgi:hypothetical protein
VIWRHGLDVRRDYQGVRDRRLVRRKISAAKIWKLRPVYQIEEVPQSPRSLLPPDALEFLGDRRFLGGFFFAAATFFDADFLAFLIAMNSPVVLSRFVQVEAPPMVVLVWLRFFTAPFRALSPVGLFFAIRVLPNIAPQSKTRFNPISSGTNRPKGA